MDSNTFTVFYTSKHPAEEGSIKFTDSNFVFKSSKSQHKESINYSDIKSLDWIYTTKGYQLRVFMNNQSYLFSGFKKEDKQKLSNIFSPANLTVNEVPFNIKGHNWGDLTTKGNLLVYEYTDGSEIFSIPMQDIKTSTVTPKNHELSIDLHDDMEPNEDSLVQIKFVYVKEREDGEEIVKKIQSSIQEYAEKGSDSGDLICTFDKLQVVAPRGKYSIDLSKKHMKLTGGTHVFKVLYKSIVQMFLLPKPGSNQMYFVVHLDVPVRLTRTPFFHMVFCFDKNDVIDGKNPIKINLTNEEIEEHYPQKGISQKMNGGVFEVVAKVFRALSGKKVIGSGSYKSFDGSPGVKCNYKTGEGYLYFIEKSVIFLYKPSLLFKYDEIKKINFQRSTDQGAKSFDLAITLKTNKKFVFSSINKQEQDLIQNFLQSKNITVENAVKTVEETKITQLDDESEEDDDDFEEKDLSESEDEDFIEEKESDTLENKKEKKTTPEKKKKDEKKDEKEEKKDKKEEKKDEKKDKKEEKKDKKEEKKDKKEDKKDKKEDKKDKKEDKKEEKKDKKEDKKEEKKKNEKKKEDKKKSTPEKKDEKKKDEKDGPLKKRKRSEEK